MTGEVHWWVQKNTFGTPVEIWVIPTHWIVRLNTTADGQPDNYYVQSPFGQGINIPYKDVVSFYEHSPLNRYEGYATSQAISEWIDAYESMIRMRLAQMVNGGVPSFHVMLGEYWGDPDDAMLARLYSKWFGRFQGPDKAGQPIITGPEVEIKPLGINPADIMEQTIETDNQSRDNTIVAFGLTKAALGLTDSMTYGSVQAAKDQFRQFSVNSELKYTGEVITEKIIKPVDQDGICFWDSRSRGDPEQIEREMAADVADGTLTINEKRTLRGRAPYEFGGSDPMINGNPVPWVTGKKEEEQVQVEQSMQRQLGYDKGNVDGRMERLRRVVRDVALQRNGHSKCFQL